MSGIWTAWTEKIPLKNLWNLLVFIAYTQLFINKKQANFNTIGAIFGPSYTKNNTILITDCFEIIILAITTSKSLYYPKLFQNP